MASREHLGDRDRAITADHGRTSRLLIVWLVQRTPWTISATRALARQRHDAGLALVPER